VALQDAGYLEAKVTNETHTVADDGIQQATVVYTTQPGQQWRVGEVIVQNNFDTQARVVRRELPFREGDVLTTSGLLLGQSDLYRLGLFRSVTIEPLAEARDDGVHDVAVNVAERPPISLQFGGGYNTRDGFRGFVEVAHNNLQGRGRRLSLRGEMALDPGEDAQPNEYLGDLGFREPRLLDSRWNLRSDLIVQRATRSIDQFSIERLAFIPAFERTVLLGLQAGLEFQVEDARIFDVEPDVLAFNPRDEGRLRTTSVGPYLVYEGRDDAFAPTRGVQPVHTILGESDVRLCRACRLGPND
jgi:outer membrane protein assembly factor BamA